MEVSDVQSLFAYNEWANARIFSSAAELEKGELTSGRGSSFSSIRDTLTHSHFGMGVVAPLARREPAGTAGMGVANGSRRFA